MHRIDFPKEKIAGIQLTYELLEKILNNTEGLDIEKTPITEESIRKIFIPNLVLSGLGLLMNVLEDFSDDTVTEEVVQDFTNIHEYFEREGPENAIAAIGRLDYEDTLGKIFPVCEATEEAFLSAIDIFDDEEEYDKASVGFLCLLFFNPVDADYWMMLGDALSSNGDYETGIYALNQAIQFAPEDPISYLYLALTYEQLDHYEWAEEYCKKALERIKKDTPQRKELLSDIKYMLNRLGSTLATF